MALTIMVFMIGWAYAAPTTTSMSGGSSSIVSQSGGATFGYAYSFYDDDDSSIQADILAVAETEGLGSVKVTTTVPTLVTKSSTADWSEDGTFTVAATGTVSASVEGISSAADVVAASRIHSFAGLSEELGLGLDEGIAGDAYISSVIGSEWVGPAFGEDGYQTGHVAGKPAGKFYADSSADGEATYSAEKDIIDDQDVILATLTTSGSAEGKTTLEGEVGADDAEIKGMVGSIDSYPIGQWLPDGLATEVLEQLALLSPLADQDQPTTDDVALVAAITTGSLATYDVEEGALAASGVANVVAVGAENDGLEADALTYAAGTSEGASGSRARVQEFDGIDTYEYKVSASKEDSMSADVQVLKALDAASAHSLLAAGSISDDGLQLSGSIANTFGGVRRENAGSATDGSDRAWGKAFISSGTWDTWAAEIDNGEIVSKSAASGNLIQESPVLGMGSGAFLQYKKNGPAYANMLLVQAAASGAEVEEEFDVGTVDAQIAVANILGPKSHTLGSSGWDGSGVSADLTDLHVEATYEDEDANPFAPTYISTDIANNEAYFWCDGTNDLQYNGPGVTSSTPVFDPAGNGNFDANIMAYLPSPTQRQTVSAIATTQPSILAII